MNDPDFRRFLEMCTTLNNEQRGPRSVLCEPPHQSCRLYERLEQKFSAHPRCQHCRSEDVRKYGRQSNRQRYQCKTCGRIFNVLTGIPLAHLNVTSISERPVKKNPVLVACDRQGSMVSDVLDHMWWEDIKAGLVSRISPGTPVCADALAQDDIVAAHLGVVLKTLIGVEGKAVCVRVFFTFSISMPP